MIEYPSNKSNVQLPSPEPLPGNGPTLNLPQDGIDSVSSATVTQALKANADFIDYTAAILNGQPAFTSNAGTGFTTVTHVGSGPSNGVAPAVISSVVSQPTANPYSYLITITTGGGIVGVKFSLSYDRGATIPITGAAPDIHGVYIDGYGTILIFTGTNVLNDTYSFRPTDVPQVLLKTADGYGKTSFDHIGFPLGSYDFELKENWIGPVTTFSSQTSFTNMVGFTQWQYKNGSSGGTIQTESGATFSGMDLQCGTMATNSFISMETAQSLFSIETNDITAVFETQITFDNLAGVYTAYLGFGRIFPYAGSDYTALFIIESTQANILWQTQNGAGITTNDTGVPIANGTYNPFRPYRMRIELFGSNTALGPCARFFINSKLVGISTTNLPLAASTELRVGFYFASGDTTAARILNVYPTNVYVNYLNSVGL